MPKVTPIQESFAAGEITPKLLGRRTIDGYKSGSRHMHNMIADSRGPAVARNGSRYSQSFDGDDVRLGFLTTGTSSSILFVLTDLLMTMTGLLGPLPSSNFLSNGDFSDGGTDWSTGVTGGGTSVNFTIGSAIINGGIIAARAAYISQQMTGLVAGIHTIIVETDGCTQAQVAQAILDAWQR